MFSCGPCLHIKVGPQSVCVDCLLACLFVYSRVRFFPYSSISSRRDVEVTSSGHQSNRLLLELGMVIYLSVQYLMRYVAAWTSMRKEGAGIKNLSL